VSEDGWQYLEEALWHAREWVGARAISRTGCRRLGVSRRSLQPGTLVVQALCALRREQQPRRPQSTLDEL